jgi:metallophosphoesterase superfamily enzyme
MDAKLQTWVCISDLQIPFQDQPVVELVLDFISQLRPHGVILNGDIIDGYGLSKFPRKSDITHTLADEIRQVQGVLAALQDIPQKVYILGNHDQRIADYIDRQAPGIASLPNLRFEEVVQTATYGYRTVGYKEVFHLGKLAVTHGHHVRKQAGATAMAHLQQYGQSVLVGHCHRLAQVYHTDLNGTHVGIESGCLCRLDGLGYMPNPDWQQGFVVVEVDPKTGWFTSQIVPVLRQSGKACFYFEGELIDLKRPKKSQR